MFSTFHESQMFALKQKDMHAEGRALRIDNMADDLYKAKLQDLPNGRAGGSEFQRGAGYNTRDVLDNLAQSDLVAVGRAIRDNDATEVGTLIIKLVTASLRKQAQDEAEEYEDEQS